MPATRTLIDMAAERPSSASQNGVENFHQLRLRSKKVSGAPSIQCGTHPLRQQILSAIHVE
jgi:hypothetical protein